MGIARSRDDSCNNALNDQQSLNEVKAVIFDALAGLATAPPTAEEVDRAKTRILQGIDRTMADARRLALRLNETIASGDWRLMFTNYEQVRQVTSEDVQGVAARYFKASNRTVGAFIAEATPDRTVVPEAPDIATLLETYTPDIEVAAGEALDPAPVSLENRIERSTVNEGVRVALVPKDTRGARVEASLRRWCADSARWASSGRHVDHRDRRRVMISM